jgi:hypothetical protein
VQRLLRAVALLALLGNAGAQQRKPGVPDIPAMQSLWSAVKAQLTGPNGQKYWEEQLKGADLPYLYGIVLSSDPKDQPRILVLAMSDKSTPEVTLAVKASHLTEKVRDGAEIIFKGVPTAFSTQPFRVTIETSQAVRVHERNR